MKELREKYSLQENKDVKEPGNNRINMNFKPKTPINEGRRKK